MAKWKSIVKYEVIVEAETEQEAYDLVDDMVAMDLPQHEWPGANVTYDGQEYPLQEVEV